MSGKYPIGMEPEALIRDWASMCLEIQAAESQSEHSVQELFQTTHTFCYIICRHDRASEFLSHYQLLSGVIEAVVRDPFLVVCLNAMELFARLSQDSVQIEVGLAERISYDLEGMEVSKNIPEWFTYKEMNSLLYFLNVCGGHLNKSGMPDRAEAILKATYGLLTGRFDDETELMLLRLCHLQFLTEYGRLKESLALLPAVFEASGEKTLKTTTVGGAAARQLLKYLKTLDPEAQTSLTARQFWEESKRASDYFEPTPPMSVHAPLKVHELIVKIERVISSFREGR